MDGILIPHLEYWMTHLHWTLMSWRAHRVGKWLERHHMRNTWGTGTRKTEEWVHINLHLKGWYVKGWFHWYCHSLERTQTNGEKLLEDTIQRILTMQPSTSGTGCPVKNLSPRAWHLGTEVGRLPRTPLRSFPALERPRTAPTEAVLHLQVTYIHQFLQCVVNLGGTTTGWRRQTSYLP